MPGPPRVKCIVLLFFLCPYATFKILFSNVGGKMSFSHRPTEQLSGGGRMLLNGHNVGLSIILQN